MEQQLADRIDSKFRYVLLTAARAEQLMRGARAKLEAVPPKPTTIAMTEVDRDVIEWGYGPSPREQEAAAAAEAAAAEAAARAESGDEEDVH